MGSVNEEITRIAGAKAAIEEAIEYCGVDVPDGNKIDTYADYIRAIPEAIFSQFTVPKVGDDDTYIKYISQKNGVISASAGNITSDVEANSVDLITSGGVYKEVIKYLPLSGGKMTGPIVFNGSDSDRYLIRVNNGSYDYNTISTYGFTLKYLGQSYNDGVGVNNVLALYADNSTNASQNLSTVWLNDGNVRNRTIEPHSSDTFNLGSSSLKWKNIYASNFIENGANINTIYADKSYADYCSSYLHSANRAQFCKPAGVTIEYSTDGGSTWIDYGATDDQKVGFFSGISQDFVLGKKLSTKATSSDMLRITMDATAMGVYISCKCLLLNVSTNGSSNFNVKVEKSMKGSADTFGTFIESQTLTGWSGWNRIPIGYNFGGGNTQNYNIAKLRLTFSSDGAGSSYTSGAHAHVLDMEVLGNTYWAIPHSMAKTGHLYTWDVKGNAIFNESVTAKYIYPNNGIVFDGTDSDRNLIRIGGNVNETIDSKSNYGYTLKYLGLGTGVNNALALYADNETADEQILGTKWLNDGTMHSRNILPHDNNTYSLGSSSLKWKNIYATAFTGHLVGTVSMTGATNNAYRNILVTNGSNGICYSSAGSVQLNYATGDVKATSFTGNLIGDVTGNVTGNLTGDVNGNVTGNAATATSATNATNATNASNIYINTSTSSSYYPMTFVTSTGKGNKELFIDGSTNISSTSTGIRYNPSLDTCYCSGGFYEASDERLKNFGDDIEVDLDKISKLSKKYFTWKKDESNTQHIGVSAQEVQDIYPELVEVIDEEGHLSVSYDKLSVVALKGIDILNDKIKSLEARLEKLEKLIYK